MSKIYKKIVRLIKEENDTELIKILPTINHQHKILIENLCNIIKKTKHLNDTSFKAIIYDISEIFETLNLKNTDKTKNMILKLIENIKMLKKSNKAITEKNNYLFYLKYDKIYSEIDDFLLDLLVFLDKEEK